MSPSRALTLLAVATLVSILCSCGAEADPAAPAAPSVSMPDRADFPEPKRGQSIGELRERMGPEGLVLGPSVSVLEAGERNRFGFGLFDAEHRQVTEAAAGVYVAREGGEVQGPFPARYQSLAVEPEFQSEGAALDPDSASSVYAAQLPFGRAGRYRVLAAVTLGDRTVAATPAAPLEVTPDSKVPAVGEPAPRISTPTVTSVGGAVDEIDTRVPPVPELHEVDFADVVGEKPTILLFATPALCQSQVCGPVVDVALQAKAAHAGDDVEFIHMEIYEDNEVESGYRPQLRAYNLPSEPWLFAVDRDGKVAARLEGAFGASELERAIEAALSG